MPDGILATREPQRRVDTKPVATANATSADIPVDGLDPDGRYRDWRDHHSRDAVAAYELDSLPSDADDSYRIEVEVTVGRSCPWAPWFIFKPTAPDKIVAGVFNMRLV